MRITTAALIRYQYQSQSMNVVARFRSAKASILVKSFFVAALRRMLKRLEQLNITKSLHFFLFVQINYLNFNSTNKFLHLLIPADTTVRAIKFPITGRYA